MAEKKLSELTALAAPTTGDLLYVVDVSAGSAGSKYMTLDTLFGNIEVPVVAQHADGFDVTPGSDSDADLLTVNVTGTPKVWWDESEDTFVTTKTVKQPGMRVSELSADPSDPPEGQGIIWQSDGTGLGDDGQLMSISTAGGVTTPYVIERLIIPSGDVSGATDLANIQAAIDTYGEVRLAAGDFYIDDSIQLDTTRNSLTGTGWNTVIRPTADTFAAIKITGDYSTVADVRTYGGLYSVHIDDATRIKLRQLEVHTCASHGIYAGTSEVTIVDINACQISTCGGAGIYMHSGASNVGNALSVRGSQIEGCASYGISFSAFGCAIHGCTIEGNGDSGIHLDATAASCTGVSIQGNYMESNGTTGEIEFEVDSGEAYALVGVSINGNIISADSGVPHIKATDANTGYPRIRDIFIGGGNYWAGTGATVKFDLDDRCRRVIIEDVLNTETNLTDYDNQVRRLERYSTVTDVFTVDCSEEKTGATAPLITLLNGTTIHEISAVCTVALNGTSPTFEVGITGNTDKYIDPSDIVVSGLGRATMISGTNNDQKKTEILSADTGIIATWTNGSGATTGTVVVRITYTVMPTYTVAIPVPA